MTLAAHPPDSHTDTGRAGRAAGLSLWFHASSAGLAVFVVLAGAAALYLFHIFCGIWAGEAVFALMALAWLYLIGEFLAGLLAMNRGVC
jgi:hypothetical protein